MKRPAVGITIGYSEKTADVFLLQDDYVRSVEKAGGLPLVFAPGRAADAGALLDRVDALVLTGGADLDPAHYDEPPHATVTGLIPERDAFELALCREAVRRDLPILAICRGHQVLNVASGGTLVQDIPSQLAGAGNHDPAVEAWETVHEVVVLPGTRLREILGSERVAVNSLHHQAVKGLGQGLVLSARAKDDGVVEGIEMPDRRFVVGVQWHPEAFWDHEPGDPLFAALLDAAR